MTRATESGHEPGRIPSRVRHPTLLRALVRGGGTGLLLTLLLAATGAFEPGALPTMFDSVREQLGHALLLILMPSFFIGAAPYFHERSRRHLHGLGNYQIGLDAWWLLAGGMIGLAYGLAFNVHPRSITGFVSLPAGAQALISLNLVLWLIVGINLSWRLQIAGAFNRAGRLVPIDVERSEGLRPFAANALDDLLVIVIALILTTVQSLDAQFRWYNYFWGILVAVPAGALLAWLPMRTVHARMLHQRGERLNDVERAIAGADPGLTTAALSHTELLYLRRDRLLRTPTWPVDMSAMQRALLYFVIPPLAWLGAALVEMGLEQALSGN